MEEINATIADGPKVSDDSKFRIILVIARRARQIQSGAVPLVRTLAMNSIGLAKEEYKEGLLPFEILLKPEKPPVA